MRVALYFGSFNPVHKGHISLAQFIVDTTDAEELWFVVSPNNPLKNQHDLLDEYIRLEMMVLATQHQPLFKVCDVEFTMPVPSYSIDTLRKLNTDFPQHSFVLLIGSDNALVFDRWKAYEQLLDAFEVWVYPRRGYDFEVVKSIYPSMRKLQSPFFDVSSTQIRNAIRNQKEISDLVPAVVAQFINENNLYL